MIELTAATLSELVASLRSTLGDGAEKRRQPRVGLRLRAHIAITPAAALAAGCSDASVPIWVRDVSGLGFGFTCPLALQKGELFSLVLAGDKPATVGCQVCHCRRVGSDVFQLGARFIDALPPRRKSH